VRKAAGPSAGPTAEGTSVACADAARIELEAARSARGPDWDKPSRRGPAAWGRNHRWRSGPARGPGLARTLAQDGLQESQLLIGRRSCLPAAAASAVAPPDGLRKAHGGDGLGGLQGAREQERSMG
jgi:hypothetical protein